MLSPMGRPSKGHRVPIMAKPLAPLAEVIKQKADEAGLSYGEFMTALAADALGMPEYAPLPATTHTQLNFPEEPATNAA